MTKYLLGLVLCLTTYGHGQTTQVVALTEDETREAAKLYAERELIELRIADLRTSIVNKHLIERGLESGVSCTGKGCEDNFFRIRYPWSGDFLFSTDFKFIVPKTGTSGSISLGGANWGYAVPATTTALGYIQPAQ